MSKVKPHLRSVGVGILTLVLTITSADTPSAQAASDAEATGANIVFQSTNKHRKDNGRSSLARAVELDAIAQAWSERMLAERRLYHNPQWWSQMPSAGKQSGAENVAYACGYGGASGNANQIMHGWKNSPGHNTNMLNGAFNYIGVGFAYDPRSDCTYATQNFGQYSQPLELTHRFVDVPPGTPHYWDIEWLANSGITTGYADGTFRPRTTVQRDTFAAFLYRQAGRPTVTLPSTSPFKDLSPGDSFYREIVWLASTGITTGYSDGTFRPKKEISREEMAALFYRSSGRPSTNSTSATTFTDMNGSSRFLKEISWMLDQGITTGFNNNTFRPMATVTRDTMAAFLRRAE